MDTALLAVGAHAFQVAATTSDGRQTSQTTTLNVQQAATQIGIDWPSSQKVVTATQQFSGWALDNASPISSVTLAVDATSLGSASYGNSRPDVCSAIGNDPGCPNVGWTLDINTAQFTSGQHTLTVTAATSDSRHTTVSASFLTADPSSTTNPGLGLKKDYIRLNGRVVAIENHP